MTRTTLNGEWRLARGPLRPDGDTDLPDPREVTEIGPASVPGNVHTELGIEDLNLDTPEIVAVNHHEWLYSRTFATPHDAAGGRTLLLFDGVDYFCDVWVNGSHAGYHEGAYSDWEVDVTDLLRPAGEQNELTLGISCPWRVDERAHTLEPATFMGKMTKNSEYMRGMFTLWWDVPLNGHAILPFGPWRDVRLEVRCGPTLLRVAGATIAVGEEQAEVELALEWWSDAERDAEVPLDVVLTPDTFDGPPQRFAGTARVAPGRSDTSMRITVADPQLWWTWDSGPQNLYRASVNGVETVLGIRTLTRDPETLEFRINGRRLFMRGTWCPPTSIYSAGPDETELRRDVELLREANMNHAVVFGHVQRDEYYDAFDRLGVIVFQELPFMQFGPQALASPDHPRHRPFMEWALGEVETIVRRARGHAALAIWGAFAETRKHGEWVWGDYTELSDRIAAIVARLDPDTSYHPSFCDYGEQHIWDGGHAYREFYDHYDRNEKFISEFGGQSPPVVETMRELIAPEALWDVEPQEGSRVPLPIDVEEWSYVWGYEYPGLMTNIARTLKHVDRELPTLERTIDAMQWYQWFGNRYCAETYRRKRFARFAGIRTWAFRDAQAGPKACMIDHRQRPRMGYYGIRAGFAPLQLQIDDRWPLRPQPAGARWERDVWLINDIHREERLTVTQRLLDPAGAELASERREAVVGGDDAVSWPLAFTLPAQPGPYLVRLDAARADGALAATCEQWVAVAPLAFDGAPVRVLLLGQARYNDPVTDALGGVGGIELIVVDETTRHPQDPSWSERLPERVDAIWLTGWDFAAHQFTSQEWRNLAAAVEAGVGFVHTGGQASFHGYNGRAALLDCTPLEPVLPVVLRPHDLVVDRWPAVDAGGARERLGVELDGLPSYGGFSRTTARPGSEVLATIGGFPLLVTGRHGAGLTAAFTAGTTRWHSHMKASEEQSEFGQDVDVVGAHWERDDVRGYDVHWRGHLGLFLGLLTAVTGRATTAPPAQLAQRLQAPLFELLAELPATELEATVAEAAFHERHGETRGVVVVRNAGATLARLVRGAVLTDATRDHRFRDGFTDLLPGEETRLRFEARCRPEQIEALRVSGLNADARVELTPALTVQD